MNDFSIYYFKKGLIRRFKNGEKNLLYVAKSEILFLQSKVSSNSVDRFKVNIHKIRAQGRFNLVQMANLSDIY